MSGTIFKEKSMAGINSTSTASSSNVSSIEATNTTERSNSLGDKIARVLNSDAMAATCVALGGALTLVGLALMFVVSAPALLPIVGVFAVTFGLFLLLNGALNFFMSTCEKSPEPSVERQESIRPPSESGAPELIEPPVESGKDASGSMSSDSNIANEDLWFDRNEITNPDDTPENGEEIDYRLRTDSGSSYQGFQQPEPPSTPPPPRFTAPVLGEGGDGSSPQSQRTFLFGGDKKGN